MSQKEQESDVSSLATLLFLGFVCVVGYLLESYWNGLFPFSISYTNTVFLASPHGLIAMCSLAVAFLVLGAFKARYPRLVITIFFVGGCIVILLLWLVIF